MTTEDKLTQLKIFLKITGSEQDVELSAFLDFSKAEILSWLYNGNIPDGVADVPTRYEPTQVMACLVGYGIVGAEGQSGHNEGGINRQFEYSTMVSYIRKNVIPYAVVM